MSWQNPYPTVAECDGTRQIHAGELRRSERRSRSPICRYSEQAREVKGDLAIADALGIQAVPITCPASIQRIAPNRHAFRWVLTLEGTLWGLPMLDRHLVFTEKDRDIIKHDVVTRGKPVMSAGKGQLQEDNTLLIDPRSGHYHPTPESVKQLAEPAFKAAGFSKVVTVKNILQDRCRQHSRSIVRPWDVREAGRHAELDSRKKQVERAEAERQHDPLAKCRTWHRPPNWTGVQCFYKSFDNRVLTKKSREIAATHAT